MSNTTLKKSSKIIKLKHSLCQSCEDEEAFYQCMCPNCIEGVYTHTTSEIDPLDILQYIDTLNLENISHTRVKEIVDLQRFLLDYEKKESNFNSIIETKCSCGHINNRDLAFRNNPHTIKCEKCKKTFCSNCKSKPHTRKKYYFNCGEYKQILNVYHGGIAQSWISAILNTEKEHNKILRKIQDEQKSIKYFNNEDLRRCPYTDYYAANKYEDALYKADNMLESSMLTRKYTPESWYKVKCKSDPVVKINCSDMYCARHNPERVNQLRANDIAVGINSNGCGRKIN